MFLFINKRIKAIEALELCNKSIELYQARSQESLSDVEVWGQSRRRPMEVGNVASFTIF